MRNSTSICPVFVQIETLMLHVSQLAGKASRFQQSSTSGPLTVTVVQSGFASLCLLICQKSWRLITAVACIYSLVKNSQLLKLWSLLCCYPAVLTGCWSTTIFSKITRANREQQRPRPGGPRYCRRSDVKGALCSLGKFKILNTEFCIFKNIDEVTFCNWINRLFSDVSLGCLKLEKWQGPAHVNKVEPYEIVLSFKISLFIQWISNGKKRRVFS